MIQMDLSHIRQFIPLPYEEARAAQLRLAHSHLQHGDGAGGEFTGWVQLPRQYDREEFARIQAAARKIQQDSQALVVIGIGGSYLGARGVIECLCSPNYNLKKKNTPNIYFIGNGLSSEALTEVMELVEDVDFSVNVISKSGTTTEPAIATRALRWMLERKYGTAGAKERIFAITDPCKGALRQMATEEGWETFVIPQNVGGRYSVLTPVGLLPLAVAGIDIMEMMNGAVDAKETYNLRSFENPVWQYAAVRNLLYRNGKAMEIFESYEPGFKMFGGWWQQLFGESEGKDGKGLFPVTAEFTADLHSLGQMIQQGQRNIFETMVRFDPPAARYTIGSDWKNLDGLNYLEGKTLDFVDEKAYLGTVAAHVDGGVPVITMDCGELNDRKVGELFYFLELCCGVSAYILDVNPFNQPGVELYKRNMFQLLGKPGYEK